MSVQIAALAYSFLETMGWLVAVFFGVGAIALIAN